MRLSISWAVSALFLLASCSGTHQRSTSFNDVGQPTISPQVSATLYQYTPQQISELAKAMKSHRKCNSSAVQTYYGGFLDLCLAYYAVMEPETERLQRINRRLDQEIIRTDPNAPHNRTWSESFCRPYCSQ